LESRLADRAPGLRVAVKRPAIIGAVLLGVLAGLWWLRDPDEPTSNISQPTPVGENSNSESPKQTAANAGTTTLPNSPEPMAVPLLGETILAGYADTNLPPENDLTLMSRLMENSLLLVKAAGHRPLSANEDWADLLRGRNGTQERFLPDEHVALNARGQLIDRWQTPLFFHALGGGRYDLRSAGPDQKLWTNDDLHRNADGSFRRGDALNATILWESGTSSTGRELGP
jgi:hypothetical protein